MRIAVTGIASDSGSKVAAIVFSALAFFAAACGESKLDTSRLESQIEQSLAKRTGIAIASVACPDDVEAKQGDTFRCTATTARNERVVLNVRQDDGEGAVTWRIARPGRGGSSG